MNLANQKSGFLFATAIALFLLLSNFNTPAEAQAELNQTPTVDVSASPYQNNLTLISWTFHNDPWPNLNGVTVEVIIDNQPAWLGKYGVATANPYSVAYAYSLEAGSHTVKTVVTDEVGASTINIFSFTSPLSYGSALNLSNVSDVFRKIWGPGSNGIILGGGLNFSTQPGFGWAQQYGGIFVTSYSIQGVQSEYLTQTNPTSITISGPTESIIEVWNLENLTVIATNISNPGYPVTFTAQPNHRYGGFAWYVDNSQKDIAIFAAQAVIESQNNPPILSYSQETGYIDDGINPDEGDTSTNFTFKIVYTDADNDPPTDIRAITFAGDSSTATADAPEPEFSNDTMILDSSAIAELRDGNYANGEQYALTKSFLAGTYRYRFQSSDGEIGTILDGIAGGKEQKFEVTENQPPTAFWAAIENAPMGVLRLRSSTETVDDNNILKELPNNWVLYVKDTHNNEQKANGYIWWEVEDKTDDTTGRMAVAKLDANGSAVEKYLSYEAGRQSELEGRATKTYDTRTDRANKIAEVVESYYNNLSTAPSLYSGNDGSNKLSLFKEVSFPEQLIFAIIAQESGGIDFNNEHVAFDYGHGIMQVTFKGYWNEPDNYLANDWDNRGIASHVKIFPCKSITNNEYYKCYTDAGLKLEKPKPYKYYNDDPNNFIYKQYTNTEQSIFSNIKDGLRVLQDKYNAISIIGNYTDTWTQEEVTITLDDMKKILAVRGYNGFGPECTRFNVNDEHLYLGPVADKLRNLNNYFDSSVVSPYSNADNLIRKLELAEDYRDSINLCSPGVIQILDPQGRTTSLEKDEIPNVFYNEEHGKQAEVYFSDSGYQYQVIGTDEGTYSLYIDHGTTTSFVALDIPIQVGAVYSFQIDWDVLSQGEKGVTLQIDSDGDGVFEQTIKADATLQPPTADINGPYEGNEGSPIFFDASNSSDPDGEIILYEWDFDGDGIYDVASASSTMARAWGDDYQGEITLRVTDDEGLTNIAATTVNVNNVAPIISNLSVEGPTHPSQEIWAGDTLNFSGDFADAGWLDTHVAKWDFGNGTTATGAITQENNPPAAIGQVTGNYIYYNAGTHTITLAVTDDDGGVITDTIQVVVKPIPVAIDCNPDTLNLRSGGKWITCYIELPAGYDVWQIDGSTVFLNGVIPIYLGKEGWAKPESNKSNIMDHDEDGILERMVKFDRETVQDILKPEEAVILTATGKVFYNQDLADFEGQDTIKVIEKGKN